MAVRDIIVVGASAGGVEALKKLSAALPADFPGSVFVTVHFPEHGTSVLPRILERCGHMPVAHATNGDAIEPGRMYVAPPNHHLLLARAGIRLVRGPRENGNRPAADPMFRSAAVAFGARVIGMVLSGNLDDGTSGLAAIKRAGGLALVQDPADALFASMPQSAIDHVSVDRIAPMREMAHALAELMHAPVQPHEAPDMSNDETEDAMSEVDLSVIGHPERQPGTVSPYSCPDCGGVLRELHDGPMLRDRCRVGHAWTSNALSAEQTTVLDDALWTALRALEENMALARQLASKHRNRGAGGLASRFDAQADAAEHKAAIIRRALLDEHPKEVESNTL